MRGSAPKHKCDIFRVAEQCGVRLVRPDQLRFGQRRARDCYAKKTLKKIGQRHGEPHLALVLRLIVETRGNAAELYSETISSISALLVASPWLVDRGGQLFDQFDEIDLGDVRRQARALSAGIPLGHVMRVLIALRLSAPTQHGMMAA